MGWDDNGLNVERRVQLLTGTNVDPTLPYDPDFRRPEKVDPKARTVAISRPNFIELCEQVVPELEAAYQELWSNVGLSVDWDHTYTSIGTQGHAHLPARLPAPGAARPRLPQRVADALGRRHAHVGRPGRAGRPRAARGVPQARLHRPRRQPAAHRHHPSRAAAGLRGRRGPPRRRALPAAVRPAGHHAAVRRVRADRRPRAGPARQGHRHRHDLHVRRHHRRHLVARAVPARAGDRAARRPAAPGHVGRPRLGGHRPRRRAGRPTTSWPARP